MRNQTDIVFSLVIPTRDRLELLKNCLYSFFSTARQPHLVEAIVMCDIDDPDLDDLKTFLMDSDWNVKLWLQRQSDRMIRDYNNYGAQCTTGKFVWILNDDCEMATPHWDAILHRKCEDFLADKPDRVLYVQVNDSTHTHWGRADEMGCCYPLLSRETVDIQNGIMPPEIDMWGADTWLYSVFKALPHNRILNAIDDIKILHHSSHNRSRKPDDIAHRVAKVSKKMQLNSEEIDYYVQLFAKHLSAGAAAPAKETTPANGTGRYLPAGFRDLIDELNYHYRTQFDRAESLRAELDQILRSRVYRALCWLRRIKGLFVPHRPPPKSDDDFEGKILEAAPLPEGAKVSLIIPLKDRGALLKNLLVSLRRGSYRRFEIILVDNGSTCSRTRAYLARLARRKRIRVVPCPGPFNFARLCNVGADWARGDYLLFLNNDMEVLTTDWLEQLLRVGAHPHVGIVGGTLLYPDGSIQHAGIFPTGTGGWTHVHRDRPGKHIGVAGELLRIRTVPAVTGACLLIGRDLFRDVGGFCEEFPVTGNDVDLCCRVRARGLHVAVTPHARLLHFESLSRGYAASGPDPRPRRYGPVENTV